MSKKAIEVALAQTTEAAGGATSGAATRSRLDNNSRLASHGPVRQNSRTIHLNSRRQAPQALPAADSAGDRAGESGRAEGSSIPYVCVGAATVPSCAELAGS